MLVRLNSALAPARIELVDDSGDNVWWSNTPAFEFPRTWAEVVRKKRQITFAWGPKGGGDLMRVAAIELAITAGRTCAVQMLLVAFSRRMCCSRVWMARRQAGLPWTSLETPTMRREEPGRS